MKTSGSNEKLVFNSRTLRLIIGALAFAFPCTVIALTGKMTTSISASYHEVQTRNVFVGFLFIIGALLVSYKGHKVIVPNDKGIKIWVLAKRYQEDLISLLGGIAAIITALFPTYCDGCTIDTIARIHATGAVILFITVVYFCIFAFPRSVNLKLERYPELKENHELVETKRAIQEKKAQGSLLRKWIYRLFPEASMFCKYASVAYRNYEEQQRSDISQGKPPKDQRTRIMDLWNLYGKKITRGWVYLGCGAVIAVVLLAFIVIVWRLPDQVAHSTLTFWIETIALWFFGVAWMTASQLQYLRKIHLFLMFRQPKIRSASQQVAELDDVSAAR